MNKDTNETVIGCMYIYNNFEPLKRLKEAGLGKAVKLKLWLTFNFD